jgi:hypothetical protein
MSDVRERIAEIAEQPAARWELLLAEAFPDDPALRAQALLWLRADREAIAAVDAPPALDARYLPGVRLDVGASAAVWQAYDRKLGRDVAIKLFHADRAIAVATALAEARAACDVISDYVVRVLDVHDGERPYIVMELVGEHDPVHRSQTAGASAAIMRPRSIDEAIRWVRDVARGVHDAHLRDVFHRDLKPHNVLITPVSRRARIADFGLASGDVRRAGTPEYMAPEHARGVAPRLDADDPEQRARLVAGDVWGLGALAYDLLSGHAPWRSDDRTLDPWELAASGAQPPALARTLDGERIPPRLRRVVEKAMALDPAARYASAGELGLELDAYLARRPTSLDRSRTLRAALFCRRNPQLSLTAGAAVLLAGLTLAAYVAVVDLRARGRALADDVAGQEAANRELAARVDRTRAELAKTETSLKSRGDALASLERALADEENALRGIIDMRDRALQNADAATHALVDQLTVARSDRAAAELGRQMYEGFWTTTRAERDKLQAALDKAQAEVARLTAAAAASSARIAELETRLAAARPDPPPAAAAVTSLDAGSAVPKAAPRSEDAGP